MVNTFHLHWIPTAEALPVLGASDLLCKYEHQDGSVRYKLLNYAGTWFNTQEYNAQVPTEWAMLPKTWR